MADSFDAGIAVEAVISLLTTNLTTQLAAVQADSAYGSDGVTLSAIATYYRALPGVPDLFPCVAVFPDGPQLTHDQSSGFQIRRHRLTLALWQQAFEEQSSSYGVVGTMQKRLERTLRAVEEVLQAGRALSLTGPAAAKIVTIGPPSYLPWDTIVEGDRERVVRGARLPLEILVK